MTTKFPEGFLFGGAVSDWQFEGGFGEAAAACSQLTSPPTATRSTRAR